MSHAHIKRSLHLAILAVAGLSVAGLARASLPASPVATMQHSHSPAYAGGDEGMQHPEGMQHAEGMRHHHGHHGDCRVHSIHAHGPHRGEMRHAPGHGHGAGTRHGHGDMRHLDGILARAGELGLSAEQVSRLRETSTRHRKEAIQRQAEARLLHVDLDTLLEQEDADLGTIRGKMEEIADVHIDQRIADLRLHRTVHDILTPEQRDALHRSHGDRAGHGENQSGPSVDPATEY